MSADEIRAAGAKLLDAEQKLDMDILDGVVHTMNTQTGDTQRAAQEVLAQFKEHPASWARVDVILQFSKSPNTKYFALQILEQAIKQRWKVLPREQCDGIKNFIVQVIIETSSDATTAAEQAMYLRKLNLVLVQIVKQEWPRNWPTFISDIVGASSASESLCINNMRILKLLSEEVFDFSGEQMTKAKAQTLKSQFCTEFESVYELCDKIMKSTSNAELVLATLETLLNFLNWIPVGYIFETDLLENLTEKFLSLAAFRNVTALCLTEVAVVPLPASSADNAETLSKYNDKLVRMFFGALEQLKKLIPPDLDLPKAYGQGDDGDQRFIQNLALFLSAFMKEHAALVEVTHDNARQQSVVSVDQLRQSHQLAMDYLLKISRVEEVEVFKVCLDYWVWLAGELYRECPFGTGMFAMSYRSNHNDRPTQRRRLYESTLNRLRYIVISRMAKPEEVLVVENEQGEVVRETIKDTDAITLYRTMKEALVYLTHLDYSDTENIMTEKLHRQVDGSEWSWKNLNTLCWAIGSISGAMQEEDEKRFLVTVIRDVLSLLRPYCNLS